MNSTRSWYDFQSADVDAMASIITGSWPTSDNNASTNSSKVFSLSNRNRTPSKGIWRGSEAGMVDFLDVGDDMMLIPLVDVGARCVIDQQAEQFWAAIVPA